MSRRLILFAMVAAVSLGGCEQTHKRDVTFTVDSKERRCDASGSGNSATIHCAYYVYGTKGEVFRNEDALVFGDRWKMDSATMQARLKVGHAYRVRTIGWRIPLLSMSPNIIEAKEVNIGGTH